jgi:hypothetical protein
MKVIDQKLIRNRYIEYIKVDFGTKNNNYMYLNMNSEIIMCFKWPNVSLIPLNIGNHYSIYLP